MRFSMQLCQDAAGAMVGKRARTAALAALVALTAHAVHAGSPREVQTDAPAPRLAPAWQAPAEVRQGAFVSVQVNVGAGGVNVVGDAANEPSIAVDPTQPNRIAIGWRQFDNAASNFRQAGFAYSSDGGRTWTFPGSLTPGVFRSDPVLSFDKNGTFYYSSLQIVGGSLSCDLFKSTDGGMSWSPPVPAFGGDKQWITVDRTNGIGSGFVYESWATVGSCCGTNVFTRSFNAGGSFQTPTNVPMQPKWGTLDVAPDGSLYIGGVDDAGVRFVVAKSPTAQDSQNLALFTTNMVSLGGAVGVFAGPSSPNPDGLLGQVWIAVDPSTGPTSGYVYVVASVDPVGPDPMDVYFIRSTNGGVTWSPAQRINDDASGLGRWQWFATMSVAPTGRIDVVWNDTRNSLTANQSQLFHSSSSDGGVSWATNTQLSPMWDSHVGFPNQNKIGDYYHMISDRVGAHLAWAATFNAEQDVYYLRIGDYDCNGNGVADLVDITQQISHDWNTNEIPDECEGLTVSGATRAAASYRLYQNVPNPFNPMTSIGFDVPDGVGVVELRVVDAYGRSVRRLWAGPLAPGRHEVPWDGRNESGSLSPSGVYFYRLEARGVVVGRKMLLTK